MQKGSKRAAGYAVHLFTASGAAVAFLALRAALEGAFPLMFFWLGVALLIDGIDGSFARAARVQETAPIFDGAILDLVIDFLTYVLVPMVAVWKSGLLPETWAFWLGVVVVTASALYFADTRMKTKDNWFRGFPALWNVFAFYVFAFQPPASLTGAAMLAGSAAMFAPVVFVHPLRVVKLRALTLAVCGVWAVCALAALYHGFPSPLWVRLGLAATALYVVGLPFARASVWAEEPSSSD
jgi:phosphatidylcholine synthase